MLVRCASSGRLISSEDLTKELTTFQKAGHSGSSSRSSIGSWSQKLSPAPSPNLAPSASAQKRGSWTVGMTKQSVSKEKKESRVLVGHTHQVLFCTFSPGGNLLASASWDQTLRIWAVKTRRTVRVLVGHTASVRHCCFSPDGNHVASASGDKTIKIWSINSGKCILTCDGHTKTATCVSYSPDGSVVASSSADSTVRLWGAASGKCLRVLKGHKSGINFVTYSPDGELLATASRDSTICLFAAEDGKIRKVLQGHSRMVFCVKFSHDSRFLASTSEDKTVRIWAASALGTQDGDTIGIGACLRVIEGHSGNVTCCDWSTCWKFLVTTSDDQTIRFWNVEDGSCLKIFNGHLAPVVSCNLSRRGNRLVTASRDRTVRLWAVNMIKKDETAETKASERKGDAAAEAKETQVQDSAELKASTAPEKKASKKDPSATVKEQIMSSTSVATTPSIVFSPESKEKKNEPASSMKQKVQSIRDDEAKAKSEIDSALHRERNEVKEEREQANTDTRNIAVSGPRIVPEEAEAADNRGVGALEGDKDYQSVAEEAVLHADNDGDLETGTTNEEDTEIDEGAANDQGDEPGHILEGEQPDQSKPNVDNSEDAETVDARASLLKLEGKAFRCTKCNAVGWAVGGEVNCPRACIEDSDAHDWTLDARSKEASGAIDSQCCECKVQLCVVS